MVVFCAYAEAERRVREYAWAPSISARRGREGGGAASDGAVSRNQ